MEINEIEKLIEISLNDFKNKKNHIERFYKEISKIQQLFKNAIGNAFIIGQWLDDFKKRFSNDSYYNEVSSLIESIEQINKKNKEDFIFDFGKKLRENFEKENLNITGSGENYSVGLMNIKIDFTAGKASLLFSRELLKGGIQLEPKAILAAYKAAEKRLIRKSFNGKEFIKDLYEAYRRAALLSGLEIGKRINIIKVLRELAFLVQSNTFEVDPKKENYRGYGRAQFAYELYRLKSENIFEYNNMKLNLGTATIDYAGKRQYSLYVPDDISGGNYIMYISFVPY